MQSRKGVAPVSYEFTQSTMSYTHRIYSDLKCTQFEGSVTLTGSISWEAATVSGWSNPVRVISSYSGYEVTGNVTVSEAEAKAEFGVLSKNILGISANELFGGDASTVGTDGYPTAFGIHPLAYR
ncbi:hypothetical protein SR914_14795 [Comamonas testosteroni]|nr:hypothetical protein [Comamonas testosteroni]WQG64496.1 hypothetical protein SR914_14795 [Comamonas testosteroni]